MTGYCNKCGETACSNKECESDIEAMAERKRFEDWHDNLFDVCAGTAVKTEYGYPQNGAIQMRWQAWQAALAAPPVERLREENARLRELLDECAGDLEAEINGRYFDEHGNVHPAMRQKYLRDMTPVIDAKQALKGAKS